MKKDDDEEIITIFNNENIQEVLNKNCFKIYEFFNRQQTSRDITVENINKMEQKHFFLHIFDLENKSWRIDNFSEKKFETIFNKIIFGERPRPFSDAKIIKKDI